MRRRRTIRLTTALGGTIGLLVGLAVLAVFGVSWAINWRTTRELLSGRAELSLGFEEVELRRLLDGAADLVSDLARQLEAGDINPGDRRQMGLLLSGAIAGDENIRALVWESPRLDLFGVLREGQRLTRMISDDRDNPLAGQAVIRALGHDGPQWSQVIYRPQLGQSLLTVYHLVLKDGAVAGVVGAAVSVERLSHTLADLSRRTGLTCFVLYGPNLVLGHPLLALRGRGGSPDRPLPAIHEIGDPALSAIWSHAEPEGIEGHLAALAGARLFDSGERQYAAFTRTIKGFGPDSLIIGGYVDTATAFPFAVRWLVWLIYCGGVMLLGVAGGVTLGRAIADRVRDFADIANAIAVLDPDRPQMVPGSRLAGLDELARAFNRLLMGLHWFETYLPHQLVRRLMQRGRDIETVKREATVLFTDLAGFTAVAETLAAEDVADMLNRHFRIVIACIEAEGGVVDKLLGDGVMAFWGLPDHQPDHAARAARAALSIRDALADGGDGGFLPVRIALHSGPVVAGNIGGPTRMEYTIVGDVVNSAERLVRLAGELRTSDAAASAILVSEDTARLLVGGFAMRGAGNHLLRGRQEPILVRYLDGDA